MSTREKLAALKAKAEAAGRNCDSGIWCYEAVGEKCNSRIVGCAFDADDNPLSGSIDGNDEAVPTMAVAEIPDHVAAAEFGRHIAAAHPTLVARMVDLIEAQHEAIESWCNAAEPLVGTPAAERAEHLYDTLFEQEGES